MKKNDLVIIKMDVDWFKEDDVIMDIHNDYYYIWRAAGKEVLVEQLPKNQVLRFFKEIYFNILSNFYRKNLQV